MKVEDCPSGAHDVPFHRNVVPSKPRTLTRPAWLRSNVMPTNDRVFGRVCDASFRHVAPSHSHVPSSIAVVVNVSPPYITIWLRIGSNAIGAPILPGGAPATS